MLASVRSEVDVARNAVIAEAAAGREASAIAAALREERDAPADDGIKRRSDAAQATARNHVDQLEKAKQRAAGTAKALAELIAAGPATRITCAQLLGEMSVAEREKYAPLVLQLSQLEARDKLLAGGKVDAVISEKPRVVHVLVHGDVHRPGDVVVARGLDAITEISPDLHLPVDAAEGDAPRETRGVDHRSEKSAAGA